MVIPSTDSLGKVDLTEVQLAKIRCVHRYREFPTGRLPRTRRMTSFTGIAPSGTVGCFSTNHHNMRLAIFGRVLSKEVEGRRLPLVETIPAPGYALPLAAYFDRIKEIVPTTAPVKLDEYPVRYGGRKRREYERAVESLKSRPLSKEDANIKLFLKFEKDVRTDKPGRIPRCILPPDVRYLVDVGRCVAPIEHKVYRAVDELWGSEVVAKGHNYRGVAKMFKVAWDRYSCPMSIDVDVSKMDQSFGRELMELFLDMVSNCSTDTDMLRKHLMWTLRSRVRGRVDDAVFEYTVDGTLSSGMPFTSLAGVVVVTGIVWLFKEHHGVDLTVVDAGDDMTIIFDRKDERLVVDSIAEWYRRFGLTLEVGKPNYHFEGIEFCQSHPCLVEGCWQMVRNPVSAAQKDAVSVRPLHSPLQAAAWLEACGLGGMASQGGSPIATARYRMMLRSSEAIRHGLIKSRRQATRYRQMVRRSYETGGSYEWYGGGMKNAGIITDQARYSFELAFGIMPHVQRAIEDAYDSITLHYQSQLTHTDMLAWDSVLAV